MRVAFYLPSLCGGKGGAEKVACQVANLLAADACEVTIFHKPSDDPPSYPLDPTIKRVAETIRDPDLIAGHRGQFDVAIGFAMQPIYVGIAVFARLIDAPFVLQECTNPTRMVTMMSSTGQEGIRGLPEAFWIRQAVLAHAAGIRVTLPSYRDTLLPEIQPHCAAFPNSFFIDPDRVRPYNPDGTRIICVGGLKTQNKNGLALLEAFVRSGLGDQGWRIDFIGGNRFEEAFDALAGQAPEGSVRDLGLIDDVYEIYNDAQFLVIPSFEEGLPNVVVEAFSFGVPVIGFSDCPGVNELVRHGARGLLVDRAEPEGLETALSTLAHSPERRAAMSRKARGFARETFDAEAFSENWRALVRHAASQRNVAGEPAPPLAETDHPLAAPMQSLLRADLLV